MITRSIPRSQWPDLFDSFSREHQEWLVTLEVRGRDIGTRIEVRDQPLVGIAAELQAAESGDTISILIGGTSESHHAHLIRAPIQISLTETEEGAHEALCIQAADGTTTLLRFRSPVLPESVDGLMPQK